MNLIDAYPFLQENKNIPFGQLLANYRIKYPNYVGELKVNKGGVGQFLEKLIGLDNKNSLQDFLDGELKTNKADLNGTPKETMFISQISTKFDELIDTKLEFETSWIYKKINNPIEIKEDYKLLYEAYKAVGNLKKEKE